MDNFNSNLEQLLNCIGENDDDFKLLVDQHYTFPLENDEMLKQFMENCKEHLEQLTNKDNSLFETELIPNISFNNITDELYESVWSYLHSLYMNAWEHIYQKKVVDILQDESNPEFDDLTTCLLNIVHNIKQDLTNKAEELENSFNIDTNILENSKIGDLAKSISEDLDISAMGDITSLATDLLSGNIENNEGFMGLIKKVSETVKDKIEGGEINVEELLNESQNMMSGGGLDGLMSGGLGDLMGNLMGGNGEGGGLGDLMGNLMGNGNLKEMASKIGNPGQLLNNLQNPHNGNATRERLLKKLEKRKQLKLELEDKEKELEELKEIVSNKQKTKRNKKNKKKKRKKKNRNY
jgi:hypothetical protein